MVVIAAGAFNMDDLGAVMREKPRRPRADGFPGEVEDADAGEDARAHRGFAFTGIFAFIVWLPTR